MTAALLLGVLVLHAAFRGSGSHGPPPEDNRDYEVVRPVRLHAVGRRHADNVRPQSVRYAMTVGGRRLQLLLEKNNDLLAGDYTETFYRDDGTQVTAAPRDIDHCYYQGGVVNDGRSSASISACHGLRGYFRTSEQRYLIEPLSGDDEGDHAVSTYPGDDFTPAVCGVTNTSWSDDDDDEPPTGRSRSRLAGASILYQQKYIELFIVADNREFVKLKKNVNELRKRTFEIVNFVNMAYRPLRTFVALVGLEIWSNRDQISVTPPAGANLDAFRRWRNDELKKKKKHDNAYLISAIDFEGATVGLAYIGTLCSDHSVGVIQDHNSRAVAVGATLAHEMGHNLGMNHDDSSACSCAGDSCIMAAALSYNIPRTFSSCSGSSFEKFLTKRNPSCLLDKPNYQQLVAPAVCGNGFREEGEQCDCGGVEDCTNPCCNATTCTLTEGSQCGGEGECCESCKISPPTTECRRKQDDCDLAEFCDGTATDCPEDVFAVNGLPCDGGLGYCYNGQCPRRPDQCVRMYGSGADEARPGCYDQNTRGLFYGFCKRPSKNAYVPCQKEDRFCGKLFCQGGSQNPNYGRMVKVSNCKAAFFDDHARDRGQVDAGTRCGDGKVCSQNECVDLETAYRNVNCSSRCPGHGVCNHRSECQCLPGWKKPSCDSEEAAGGLSTGATVGIALAVLLLLGGAVAAAVGIVWKKRRSPVALTSRQKPPVAQRAPPSQPPPPLRQGGKPKPTGAPPPPPPAGNRTKPLATSYAAARQALRPVPNPKV